MPLYEKSNTTQHLCNDFKCLTMTLCITPRRQIRGLSILLLTLLYTANLKSVYYYMYNGKSVFNVLKTSNDPTMHGKTSERPYNLFFWLLIEPFYGTFKGF